MNGVSKDLAAILQQVQTLEAEKARLIQENNKLREDVSTRNHLIHALVGKYYKLQQSLGVSTQNQSEAHKTATTLDEARESISQESLPSPSLIHNVSSVNDDRTQSHTLSPDLNSIPSPSLNFTSPSIPVGPPPLPTSILQNDQLPNFPPGQAPHTQDSFLPVDVLSPKKIKQETQQKRFVATERRKNEREMMKGTICEKCGTFSDLCGHLGVHHHHMDYSRHRHQHTPPHTPEAYWDISLGDSAELPDSDDERGEKREKEE
ncbi:hypothetical protein BLNAU_2483 [Blattamonas nauphoetae]|uniref:DNA endonuclease activator Ctp1 C-terminal domain-containing protein n=1 Tax=Blattamonas nauphoetae TaxID=2049346 RepID=A0ABQ9YFW7_9EUKA|nr:hypothetical protein BLNAU_2483 [Blattamonas nauphoetae]